MPKYILPKVDYGRNLDEKIKGCENFYYWEAVSSMNAVRLNIANVPTEAQWLAIEWFAVNVLQPLRNKCGKIMLSSWFRCKLLNSNSAVSGSVTSFHLTGGGADLEPLECSLIELLNEAYKLPLFSEIIAEYFPHGWVHIGALKGDNSRKLKLKDHAHNFSLITIEKLNKLY